MAWRALSGAPGTAPGAGRDRRSGAQWHSRGGSDGRHDARPRGRRAGGNESGSAVVIATANSLSSARPHRLSVRISAFQAGERSSTLRGAAAGRSTGRAQRAHNPRQVGSTPTPATLLSPTDRQAAYEAADAGSTPARSTQAQLAQQQSTPLTPERPRGQHLHWVPWCHLPSREGAGL